MDYKANHFKYNIVSEIKTIENGKKVIFVDNMPFQAYGVQIRTDRWRNVGGYTNEQMTEKGLFRWAKELNANCVQVTATWKDCESQENRFDWTNLNWMIEECKKSNLRLEIIWFGSNVCGAGWHSMTPDWIVNNPQKYTRIIKEDGSAVGESYKHPLDGQKYTLCVENANLQAAERNMIMNLMNHLDVYDRDNIVIGFQAENEPSLVQHNPFLNETDRCHCSICDDLYVKGGYTDGRKFSLDRLAVYVDRVASWVKSSKRKMITRINFIPPYYMMDESVKKFRELAPNVDFCGYDSYEVPQSWLYNVLKTEYSVYGNIPHVSELGGFDPNCRKVMIDTFAANGCGVEIYQLTGYSNAEDNFLVDDQGKDVFEHTDEIRQIFKMLGKVMRKLAVLRNGNSDEIQYFNCEGYTNQKCSVDKKLANVEINYSTEVAGMAIAFVDNGDLVLMSDKAGTFNVKGIIPSICETGEYSKNDDTWIKQNEKEFMDNGDGCYTICLNDYEIVRFRR